MSSFTAYAASITEPSVELTNYKFVASAELHIASFQVTINQCSETVYVNSTEGTYYYVVRYVSGIEPQL